MICEIETDVTVHEGVNDKPLTEITHVAGEMKLVPDKVSDPPVVGKEEGMVFGP